MSMPLPMSMSMPLPMPMLMPMPMPMLTTALLQGVEEVQDAPLLGVPNPVYLYVVESH